MAHSRGFARGRQFGSSRRQTGWSVGPGDELATTITAAGSTLIGTAIVATTDGTTIVRIRGFLRAFLNNATSNGDGFQGAFGIGIASLAAVTAGVGSVSTPITEIGSDNWLFWHVLSLHAAEASEATFGDETMQDIVVDTKAMRKAPTDLAIYAAVEVVEIGTASMTMFFDSRSLAKLP